jgi:hypothetical protein
MREQGQHTQEGGVTRPLEELVLIALQLCLNDDSVHWLALVKQDDEVGATSDEKFFAKWAELEENAGVGVCPDGIAGPNSLTDFITDTG